jgi:putative acetyltransferase
MTAPIDIRPATDADGDELAALIRDCFAEYPGCVFARAEEMPELDAIASHFAAAGGCIWVAENGARIVGSLGVKPRADRVAELVKVYVAQECRGSGLAQRLLARGLAFAADDGAERVELWSDTRFTRGHGFYAKEGFTATGETRFLADLSDTWEYRFVRGLDEDVS